MQTRNAEVSYDREPAPTLAGPDMSKLLYIGAWMLFAMSATHAATLPAAVELDMHGLRYTLNQSRDPAEGNYEVIARETALVTSDGRYRYSTDTRYPGNITFRFLVGSPSGSSTVDLLKWRNGIEIERDDAATARKSYADLLFLAPAMLLNLSNQRSDGGETADGVHIESMLDPANRPATIAVDTKSGDIVRAKSDKLSYEYSGYAVRDGIRQPGHINVRDGDRLVASWDVAAKSTAPAANAFDLPAGYIETQAKGSLRATLVADGAYRVDGTESGYHTGFVVGSMGVAVFDAPVSPQEAAKVRALIEETAPGRKITHIVLSHGHRDHIAGLPAYLPQEGVQVLVGRGGMQALRRQMGDGVAARAREVLEETTIDLGSRKVRLVPLASSHANDMLVAYDASSHTIFHGDLFYLPEVGPIPPAFDVSVELQDLIAKHHMQADHLVGVHGRSGTDDDLRASIALRAMTPQAIQKKTAVRRLSVWSKPK